MSSTYRSRAGGYTYYAPTRDGIQADAISVRNNMHYPMYGLLPPAVRGQGRVSSLNRLAEPFGLVRVGIIGGCRKLDKIDLSDTPLGW